MNTFKKLALATSLLSIFSTSAFADASEYTEGVTAGGLQTTIQAQAPVTMSTMTESSGYQATVVDPTFYWVGDGLSLTTINEVTTPKITFHAGVGNYDGFHRGANFSYGGELSLFTINDETVLVPDAVLLIGLPENRDVFFMPHIGGSVATGFTRGLDLLFPLHVSDMPPGYDAEIRVGFTEFQNAIGGAKSMGEVGLNFTFF